MGLSGDWKSGSGRIALVLHATAWGRPHRKRDMPPSHSSETFHRSVGMRGDTPRTIGSLLAISDAPFVRRPQNDARPRLNRFPVRSERWR